MGFVGFVFVWPEVSASGFFVRPLDGGLEREVKLRVRMEPLRLLALLRGFAVALCFDTCFVDCREVPRSPSRRCPLRRSANRTRQSGLALQFQPCRPSVATSISSIGPRQLTLTPQICGRVVSVEARNVSASRLRYGSESVMAFMS